MSQPNSGGAHVQFSSNSEESDSSVEFILDSPNDPSSLQAGPANYGISLATREPMRVPAGTHPIGGRVNPPPHRRPRRAGHSSPPPPYVNPPTYSNPPPQPGADPSGSSSPSPTPSPPPPYPSASAAAPPPPALSPPAPSVSRRRFREDIVQASDREAERIRNYFETNPSQFTFEGKIGNGTTGVTCQIKQRRRWYSTSSRRFVVKRAFFPYQEHFLRNEIHVIRRLRGAQHIVQPFKISRGRRNPLRDVSGPTLYMELIENGNLREFVDRARNWGYPLPNRLLIRFFLCLVQFCIAMAWPPRGRRGAPQERERIPTSANRRNNKYQLRHNDMHLRHILIGDVNPADQRHDIVPILKLIDFDRALLLRDHARQDVGVKSNIFDIGTVMRSLITQGLPLSPQSADLIVEWPDGTQKTIRSYGSDITRADYPNLDPELGIIVAQCLTITVEELPALEDLYIAVRNLSQWRTSDYYQDYPRAQHETDEAMGRILQELILDADH